jgi:hypothetical protein
VCLRKNKCLKKNFEKLKENLPDIPDPKAYKFLV